VTLYEIIEAHEPLWRTRRCSMGQADCSDERACPLHEPWKQTSEHFLRRLTDTSLADVLRFCKRRPESGYPLPGPRD
jgi:DNA-binding IscR family transcriptional regulator